MLTEDSNYPCILQGLVLPGLQIGKGKGFATANIDPLTNEKVIASIGHGVYWGILWICKDKLTCSSHETGLRTVFSVGLSVAHSAPSIEAHIIDPSYSGEDLYNNYIYILIQKDLSFLESR
ncbi:uncharacterized protein MONOS_9355 [Monocercomonoides exilis]|uniref:uncharacterized protein n=1 Tax=Monocercomonoides exilis TaxID=2049356 RepID=UPI00355A26D5|nr:hypothetical protein MONOS_9355 [Monocercomonoides exilis]|eukprot:MONOS_9355.1-p1 / transcript=MONOS_9355.1 / gene=MONOS_9355 / organism=Monocercomonoides_exilis_PA203 / gene_product=unspecified product / transcript_product=unspecified product / location=Mono_scaffold00383:45930-46505(+) / protein_length=120 / sequence_SO=supercontig / SO=protein_coding / is_pseudo=false